MMRVEEEDTNDPNSVSPDHSNYGSPPLSKAITKLDEGPPTLNVSKRTSKMTDVPSRPDIIKKSTLKKEAKSKPDKSKLTIASLKKSDTKSSSMASPVPTKVSKGGRNS